MGLMMDVHDQSLGPGVTVAASPTLTPAWRPVPLPDDCAPAGAPLFPVTIDPVTGMLATGGSRTLCVLEIRTRQRIALTVVAKVGISGFAFGAGALYVQDGPVLSRWDSATGDCLAAVNLATGEPPWTRDDDGDASTPPDTFYGTGGRPPVRYSAPRVRDQELQATTSASVFVLGDDGALFACDVALASLGSFPGLDAPAVADLALAELLQPDGGYLCRLYYVAADGGIRAIDATASPPKPVAGWPTGGAPDATRVLPLRVIDDLLWGGGLPGADFFARPLDPARPATIVVAAPADAPHGWREYDVAPSEKLALVSDGARSRLTSYAADAGVRDRWLLHGASTVPCHTLLWPGTGADARPPLSDARLALEIDDRAPDGAAGGGLGARVLLANTVRAVDPMPGFFPIDAIVLDTPTLGPGAFPTLPRVAQMRARPAIALQTLYAVVRATPDGPGHDCVAAWSLAGEANAVLPAAREGLKVLDERGRWFRFFFYAYLDMREYDVSNVTIHYSRPGFPTFSGHPGQYGEVKVPYCYIASTPTFDEWLRSWDPQRYEVTLVDFLKPWDRGSYMAGQCGVSIFTRR